MSGYVGGRKPGAKNKRPAFSQADNTARYESRNRERYLMLKKRAWQRLRERALNALGARCVDCGIDDILVLQIDHKFGDGWKDRQKGHRRDGPLTAIREPERHEIRCANCHVRKTRMNGEYVHVGSRPDRSPAKKKQQLQFFD